MSPDADTQEFQPAAPKLSRAHLWLSRLEDLFSLAAAWFIFALMVLGVVQVLGRQFFDKPVWGYIDMIELSMATFAFLGVAFCQRQGGHVRMDLIVNRTKGRLHWLLEAFGVLVALLLIGVLIWYGWEHFMRAWTYGDSTIDAEFPVWPSKLLVPLSFGLLWLRLLLQLIGYLRLLGNPDLEPVAVPRILTVEELAAKEIEDATSTPSQVN